MKQCLSLAKQGMGNVAPNPMVGCVIVHNNKIIGQGYHEKFGEAHAEVNAINSVKDKTLLKESTLYVSLEPCAHFGKTPPCSNLIIEHKIPNVFIGCIDSFSEVSGKGIEKMEAEGINVTSGILEKESLELNKRFFTFHNKKRPYIILKWAQTLDGFMDVDRTNITNPTVILSQSKEKKVNLNVDNWITNPQSKKLVHQWRSEEQAIMVGTNTAFNDNPELTVREVEGKNPLRIVLDLNLRLPNHLHLFDQSTPTLVINYSKNSILENIEYVKIDTHQNLTNQILEVLYNRNILSVIIEGGNLLLNTFINNNQWDEARIFTGKKEFIKGLKSPQLNHPISSTENINEDRLDIYYND